MSKTPNSIIDRRSRSYLLTINNPQQHNETHDVIKSKLNELNVRYYCLSDEIGETGTYHTHTYFYCHNAVKFSRVKKLFMSAHIDECKGSAFENRNYILKIGHPDKADTIVPNSFEEWGDIPNNSKSKNTSISSEVIELISKGATDKEIVEKIPTVYKDLLKIKTARNIIIGDEYKNKKRDVSVTIITGNDDIELTKEVYDMYGYSIYRIVDYENEYLFDNYDMQDIIVFDLFTGAIPISKMIKYSDGYPIQLKARYSDKTACFSKIVIVCNKDFKTIYQKEIIKNKKSYNLFIKKYVTEFIVINKAENENENIISYLDTALLLVED